MNKIPSWPLLLLFSFLFFGEFMVSSCATRSSPSGGPRDTTAPALDTSFPANFSTGFNQQSVQLIFEEYISLKSPSQQIRFSPPLKQKPKISPRGKEIEISWSDTLLPNTTYTISFGNSITDYTEGNVNANFKYVFSTGDFIDSLELQGAVVNSKTGTGEKEMLVAMYELSKLDSTDSIAYKNLPTYYTYTDEYGGFKFSNLKYGNFHVVAFEDKRGNFMLNTGAEKIAFLSHSLKLNDTTQPISLYSYQPKTEGRFFGSKHIAANKIQLAFNYPVPGLQVEPLYASSDSLKDLLSFSSNKDTAIYWFDQQERDSLVLVISNEDEILDTSNIFLRSYDAPKFTAAPIHTSVNFNKPIVLKTNQPVAKLNKDKILIYSPKDSLKLSEASITDALSVELQLEKKAPAFTVYLKPGAMESFTGVANDSLSVEITTLSREELGNLDFIVEADTNLPLVLVFYTPQKKELLRRSFQGKTKVELDLKKPGIYPIELIIDRDGDGEWTPGNYLERKQPERIIQYSDKAEIRANWDLELIWQPEVQEKIIAD